MRKDTQIDKTPTTNKNPKKEGGKAMHRATAQGNEILGESRSEFTHGHSPRGEGRWGFEDTQGKQYWYYGTYTEAKKQALKEIWMPNLLT